MQKQDPNSTKVTTADVFGVLYLAANSHATTITPLIRNDFGTEAFHPYGLFAFIGLLLLTEGRWASCVGIYTAVWFIALLYRRIETYSLRRQGIIIHSRYLGHPWLAMKLPFIKTVEQAKTFEPFMCLVIGRVLYVGSETLGRLVMAGFVSLSASMLIDKFVTYRRVMQMQDAQIEGEYYAEQYRSKR